MKNLIDLPKTLGSNGQNGTLKNSLNEITANETHPSLNNHTCNDHFVQFYEDDSYLVNSVKDFLSKGDSAVVLATEAHRKAIENGLTLNGINVKEARKDGSYKSLDAEETLNRFMIDGLPDPGLFFSIITGIIFQIPQKKSKNLRAFGEMVAILWARGNREGAIQLESLWNNLQANFPFQLYCAYPIKDLEGKDNTSQFMEICSQHSHVFPAESYSRLNNEEDRLKEIAILQQKSISLEREIRERIKIEKALRMSEKKYRKLFEAANDGVIILDLKTFTIQDLNPFVENLLGLSKNELKGSKLFEAGFFKDEKASIDAFKILKKKRSLRMDIPLEIQNSENKVVEIFASVLKEKSQHVVLCNIRDITARKKLEEQKNEFLEIVSHELKTPVTSMKAFSQMLHRKFKTEGNENSAGYLGKMNSQIDKLMVLIDDLLAITKINNGKLTVRRSLFSIDKLVDEVVEEMQMNSTKHKIILKGKCSQKISGDREKICEVLINLISNAIKYSPSADKIIVTLSNDNDSVIVSVKDFGIGIKKKDHSHIFERFYRVSNGYANTFPGLGLGLYISSEIIKVHNGKIWVESEYGKGSEFYFSLPVNKNEFILNGKNKNIKSNSDNYKNLKILTGSRK